MVTAQIAGGAKVSCTALADGTQDPFQASGFSAFLTFGLIADGDTTGGTAHADLAKAGASITIDLATGTRTHLELHAGGSGCVASAGTLHLSVDANGALDGDFTATGAVPMGGPACSFTGTVAAVPIVR
jgi:hypothetical protein